MPHTPKVRIRRPNSTLTTREPALERMAWSMEAGGLVLAARAG
jgi:hypothetical protein